MSGPADDALRATFGGDVRLHQITPHVDDRGSLVELDFAAVPFPVRRAFAVTEVPVGCTRGGHRHHDVEQLLCCISGRVEVELRRGDARHELELTRDLGGLYLAPGVWASQRYVVEGAALLVLASAPFDPSSYDSSY